MHWLWLNHVKLLSFPAFVVGALLLAVLVFEQRPVMAAGAKMAPVPAELADSLRGPSPLVVQVQQRRNFNPLRGIFRALTGGGNTNNRRRRAAQPPRTNRTQRPAPRSTTRRTTKRRDTAAAASIPRIQKDPNAAKVLVIGDRLADGLAAGLAREFADDPMIAVTGRVYASSGLASKTPYDWSEKLPELMTEIDPHLVVVQIGLNDFGEIDRGDLPPAAFGSAEWNSIYYQRVSEIVRIVRDKRLPIIWVGFAPAADAAVSGKLEQLNSRFRGAVVENGGAFIDIWRPFAGEDGNFSATGPDKRGQVKELRPSDGLTFTQDGYDKIAFFVGRPVRQFLGQMGVLFGLAIEEQTGGRVISLTRPQVPETTELAGLEQVPEAERRAAEARRKAEEATIAFANPAVVEGAVDTNEKAARLLVTLLEQGELPVVPGRADAFRMPAAAFADVPDSSYDDISGPNSPFSIRPRAPTEGFEREQGSGPAAPQASAAPSRIRTDPASRSRPAATRRRDAPGLPGVQIR